MSTIDGGLRQIFRDKLKGFHWQSIESHSTGQGTPDSNYCCRGTHAWIEYKKTESNKIPSLKGEQVGWIETRIRHGGMVWIAVRQRRPNQAAEDRLWLIRGELARCLYERGINGCQTIWGWGGGPGEWDWAAIGRLLAPGPQK